jgi:hypothetical protein
MCRILSVQIYVALNSVSNWTPTDLIGSIMILLFYFLNLRSTR